MSKELSYELKKKSSSSEQENASLISGLVLCVLFIGAPSMNNNCVPSRSFALFLNTAIAYRNNARSAYKHDVCCVMETFLSM